jgi:arsenite oxidase small subunit
MTKTANEALNGCGMTRRGVTQALVLCTCAFAALKSGAVAAAGESPSVSLKAGDRFALEPESGAPVAIKVGDLKPGQAIMGAYPLDPSSGTLRTETRFNMANLVRLSGEPKGDLAKTQGIAAFSAICTHKGCAITSWQPDNNHWRCFCHMSEFDAADKGERVEGPATDPLPTIPIAIDAEGYIVATGGFSAPPGGTA